MEGNPVWKPEEQAVFKLRSLYRRYGYLPYKMSKFEEYDLYVRSKSFLPDGRILTFTDTDGKLMALKPDVTLSILKNSRMGGGLQKVYYNETVYRTSPTSHSYKEIMQTGLECIGALDDYAVGEVVMLAARSLETISGDYLLDLSHLGIANGLLSTYVESEEKTAALLSAMGEKNVPLLKKLSQDFALPEELTERLIRLTTLYDTPEKALPLLSACVEPGPSAEALRELTGLCELLKSCCLGDRIRLDFSMVNDKNYYTGVIFKGYLPGAASAVLSGGRYDGLLHQMGREGGAIGFAVYLDQLERLKASPKGYDADVLLLYDDATSAAGVAAAAGALLAGGKTVRADREIPRDFTYRELRDLRKGGASC